MRRGPARRNVDRLQTRATCARRPFRPPRGRRSRTPQGGNGPRSDPDGPGRGSSAAPPAPRPAGRTGPLAKVPSPGGCRDPETWSSTGRRGDESVPITPGRSLRERPQGRGRKLHLRVAEDPNSVEGFSSKMSTPLTPAQRRYSRPRVRGVKLSTSVLGLLVGGKTIDPQTIPETCVDNSNTRSESKRHTFHPDCSLGVKVPSRREESPTGRGRCVGNVPYTRRGPAGAVSPSVRVDLYEPVPPKIRSLLPSPGLKAGVPVYSNPHPPGPGRVRVRSVKNF